MDIPLDQIDADLSSVREDKIEELTASLATIGMLLHPITVRPKVDGRYQLIAGKVRLKTFQRLNRSTIPVIIETSAVSPIEIAIHENLRRSNLPWYEQVELELKLHELRQEQHGKRKIGRNAAASGGWSQEDTAKELGIALGAMSQDIFLANVLKRNPHLAKVQDKMTALKLAKEATRREIIEAETLIPSDFEMDQILCGDSSEVLKEIPSELFNVCITDPPWLKYKDEQFTRDEDTLPVFKEVYRVLKRDSLLYMTVSTPDFIFYQQELAKIGFIVQEYPAIWHKPGVISHGRRPWELARDIELILVAAKGHPVLYIGTQLSDVLMAPPVPSTKLIHPNEKPVNLLRTLIRYSTFDEGRVLDPFAGSGAVLEAAYGMKRRYVGIERNYHYFEKIQRRLEKCMNISPATELQQPSSS